MSGSEPTLGRDAPPLVGISTYVEQARHGVWLEEAALVPYSYVEATARAGGCPLLLPPSPLPPQGVQHALDAVLSTLDALVLTGGPDVDPARYGAEPHEATGRPRPARDAWEEELCRGALARDLPVLAICRGLQVLNVALGGTLHQHLPDLVGHEGHRTAPGEMSPNDVTMVAGTRLASVLGGQARGHCHHHQAIDRLGRGLVVAARAEDGTVEAAELPGPTFAVGVQWHPEDNPDDDRLFVALLQAALRARPHRGPVVPSPRGGPDR